MGYQVKNEDESKPVTLTLTGGQLEAIAAALESYCLQLGKDGEKDYLVIMADAQEAVLDVLESNFGVEV